MTPPQHLYASGSNAQGQLATGTQEDSHTFTPCIFHNHQPGHFPPNTAKVLQIANGANHTLILLQTSPNGESEHSNTELWGCGDGSKGQLGVSRDRHPAMVFRPVDLELEKFGLGNFQVRLVAAGWETSFIVLSQPGGDDVLISIGTDDFGDLGIGPSKTKEQKPFCIVDLSHIKPQGPLTITSIAAGPHHTVIQLQGSTADGSESKILAGWGKSRHRQLGNDLHTKPFISTPHKISVDAHISSFSLGNQHTVFLTDQGRCIAMGSDHKGQITGVPDLENVKAVGCTWNGTYAIVQEPEPQGAALWSAGSNSKGQRGHSFTDLTFFPIDVPMGIGSLEAFACGSEHALALFRGEDSGDGAAWGWGWNEHGNLGNGNTEDVYVPVQVWPVEGRNECAVSVWAGCGTSWILSQDS